MPVGVQYKTSNIVHNDTLIGFNDNFELNNKVNTEYEEMLSQVGGMPTGGSLSVRTHGYRKPQEGETHVISPIEQEFETILVKPTQMLGDSVAVRSTEFAVDRNTITDTTHYETSMAMASKANLECYKELSENVCTFVDIDSNSVSFDALSTVRRYAKELGIPQRNSCLVFNTADYESLTRSVNAGTIFDQPLTQEANQFVMKRYAGIDLIESSTLITQTHTAGTAGGKTLTFGALVSTDTYKSAVIDLAGATDGDTLIPGDRLTFAVTKLLHPTAREATSVPLQLIVKNSVTATASSFSGVQVVCGIAQIADFPSFGNVTENPIQGENVVVRNTYKANYYVTKPGFTFATIRLDNISTLEIRDWYASGTRKAMLSIQSRNPEQPNASFNMRTSFDADLTVGKMIMRIDCQPAYKAFLRYNVAMLTNV